MRRPVFVTATGTDIGKTYASLALLEALADRGLRVGAIKPIETGVASCPQDGTALWEACRRLNPDFAAICADDVVPVCFPLPAAPAVASEGEAIDWEKISRAYDAVAAVSDIVVIEGAGGVLTPVDAERSMIDLARFFDAVVLVVGSGRLGMINDLLLSLEALNRRGFDPLWCVNLRPGEADGFGTISRPYLLSKFGRVMILDHDIAQIACALDEKSRDIKEGNG